MIPYLLAAVGVLLIIAACVLIYVPLALLVAGGALIAVAYYGVEAN